MGAPAMDHLYRRFALVALTAAILLAPFSFAGCDRSLFGQDDKEIQNRLGYFDDATSATKDREAREHDATIGFGYPSGPSEQQQ